MASQMSDQEYNSAVSAVWRATAILTVVTIVEVVFALTLGHKLPRILVNGVYVIASLAKAFFIIGEFMHLKYEKRVFMLSLGLPLAFLVWALIAFVMDGNAYFHANFPK